MYRFCLESYRSCDFSFVRRSTNTVAHTLTSIRIYLGWGIVFGPSPLWLLRPLSRDVVSSWCSGSLINNTIYYRLEKKKFNGDANKNSLLVYLPSFVLLNWYLHYFRCWSTTEALFLLEPLHIDNHKLANWVLIPLQQLPRFNVLLPWEPNLPLYVQKGNTSQITRCKNNTNCIPKVSVNWISCTFICNYCGEYDSNFITAKF